MSRPGQHKHENPETQTLLPKSGKMAGSSYDNMGYDASMEDLGSGSNPKKVKLGAKKVLVVMSILVCELCERLTYYSVVANLVLYCTSVLKYTSPDAATIQLVFNGCVYLIPVLGGYVADAVAGRYNTIFGSSLLYLIGLFLLPASAIDYRSLFGMADDGSGYDMSLESRRAFFMVALFFIAIGTGGIKANVGPFGAQQVEGLGEDAVQSFFNWFYWFINVGALVAYSGVAYLQQNVDWAWGYSVPLFSMILALIVFTLARRTYIHTPPGGSVLTTVCAVYRKGCNKARQSRGGPFDDYTVEGALSVIRVLPIFLLMIFYWAIYSQMSTTFFLQAERMNVKVGDVILPAAMLNIFNTIIILLLIPLVDRVVYPFFNRIGRPLTHLQRMGTGLVFAACSVIVAGVIEIYRKQDIADNGSIKQTLGDETFNSAHMSVFVQTPEYAFVGASEVFASITGLEFAFTQAPRSMQGLLTGLFMMTSGLGSFLASAILKIVEKATEGDPWFPDDINDGKAENLFFLMGGLMFLDFIVFLFVAKWYTYLKHEPEDAQEDTLKKLPDSKGVDDGYTICYDDMDNVNTKM